VVYNLINAGEALHHPSPDMTTINAVRLAFLAHEFQGYLVDLGRGNGYRLTWRGEQYFFYTAKQCIEWAAIHIDD
jgi:hypothetical protein